VWQPVIVRDIISSRYILERMSELRARDLVKKRNLGNTLSHENKLLANRWSWQHIIFKRRNHNNQCRSLSCDQPSRFSVLRNMHLRLHPVAALPIKMEQAECSERLAHKIQMPENHLKERIIKKHTQPHVHPHPCTEALFEAYQVLSQLDLTLIVSCKWQHLQKWDATKDKGADT
jgi:hypothetical protein